MIKPLVPADPVYQHAWDATWWFADALWAEEYGPFNTEAEARAELNKYVAETICE